jgi:hypothetical protein
MGMCGIPLRAKQDAQSIAEAPGVFLICLPASRSKSRALARRTDEYPRMLRHKRGGMMKSRLAILGTVFALTAIVAPTTPASASSPSVGLNATVTGTVTGGTAWCCGRRLDFQGSAVVMGIGRVEFSGTWLGGCSFPTLPTPCFRRLDLALVARNGDRLAISGNDEWVRPFDPEPQATTWSVDQTSSSGRFADFAASGTYTFAFDATTVVVTLAGTRHQQTTWRGESVDAAS